MKKKLISKDYTNYVFEAFKVSKEDFYHYYLDIVENHIKYNPRIVEKLAKGVEYWIDWYSSQIYGGLISVKRPDGSVEVMDRFQTFLVNEKGEESKIDMKETKVPLFPEFGIQRHVDRSFFDTQLSALELIQEGINIKKKIQDFYNSLPQEYKILIDKDIVPEGIHFEDINAAFEAINNLPPLKERATGSMSKIESILSIAETEAFKNLKLKNYDESESYSVLKDIFKNEDNYQLSVDILKRTSPPLLNKNEVWIGDRKGAICLWVDLLKREDYIKFLSDDIYAKLISEKFRFSIDSSNFRKTHKQAEEKYFWQLKDFISKLSQNSQSSRIGK